MSPSNSIAAGQSYPSCLTLSLVVYYDRYFKDGLGGNTAAGSVARYFLLGCTGKSLSEAFFLQNMGRTC